MFTFSALDTLVYWQEEVHPRLSLCSTQFAIKATIFLHYPISPGSYSGGAQKQHCAEECLKCHTRPATSGRHKNIAKAQQNTVGTWFYAHATGKHCTYCFLLKEMLFNCWFILCALEICWLCQNEMKAKKTHEYHLFFFKYIKLRTSPGVMSKWKTKCHNLSPSRNTGEKLLKWHMWWQFAITDHFRLYFIRQWLIKPQLFHKQKWRKNRKSPGEETGSVSLNKILFSTKLPLQSHQSTRKGSF